MKQVNSAKPAAWWHSLHLLWLMPQQQLQRDLRSFTVKWMPWTTSIQLLRTMGQVFLCPNHITFSAMIPSQSWRGALNLCTVLRWSDGTAMDRVTFDSAIRSCCQVWPHAQALLESMQVQSVSANHMTYNAVLNSLKSQWKLSLKVLETMPSMRIRPDTVSYSLGSQWQYATALLFELPSRSLRVDALGLREAAMLGPWQPALDLLQILPEETQQVVSVTYASAFLWQGALETREVIGFNFLLKSMHPTQWQTTSHVLLHMVQSQVQATLVTYNTFLSRLSSWQQALAWLQCFSQIDLDLVTWGTVISSCADAQQRTWSLQLLQCMAKAQLQLNLVVCNAALSASASWCHSIKLLQQMLQQQLVPDAVSLNTVLNYFSSDAFVAKSPGPWQLALSLLGRPFLRVDDTSFTMCSLALSRATQWCSSLTLSDVHTAMGAYETLGRWQQALQHFPKENATEVSFNLGISACEKGGAWQSSLQLLKAMTPVRLAPDVIGWSSSISASEKRQKWPVAVQLLEVMLRAEVLPNSISYNSATRAVRTEWSLALAFFHSTVQHRQHNLISSNIAVLACEQGLCHSLAIILLNNDLPRMSLQMIAARSGCQV